MRQLFKLYREYHFARRYSHNATSDNAFSLIRNIGILAHIDAGKTTTTERMLFYSGKIHSMGEVHRGNTVTDFMDQERERGITISSAAVSFPWKGHQFNLIDTPGHIDFTIEVERSLNVLDGAVVILDGSAGVEAQTMTVWRQANRYALPRIIYLNKMDRPNASLELCLSTLESKLNVYPLVLHIPLYDADEKLDGVTDLVTLKEIRWGKGDGRNITAADLKEDDAQKWEEAVGLRRELVERLADYDDAVAHSIITNESHEIPPKMLCDAIRKVTLSQKCFPVLCGSSYKNIGVQALMDAVILYLPSPKERNEQIRTCFGNDLCARAFKVIHDKQKKPVTYFRVYSGVMTKGQKVYNIQQQKNDHIAKLMVPYADEMPEAVSISGGHIAAVAGLKDTATGDFITSSTSAANNAKKKLGEMKENISSQHNFGLISATPAPVFFCSIEAPSQAYQAQLDLALYNMQREDPSLVVFQDEFTGQTILGGMGELHLEIIKHRIKGEYKIDVELGPLQIAYQEYPKLLQKKETHVLEHRVGSSLQKTAITFSLMSKKLNEKNSLLLDRSPESAQNIASLTQRTLAAIKLGVDRALAHGPTLGYPIVDVSVMLHWCETGRGTTEATISAGASQCVEKLLKSAGTYLREPMMLVEVVTEKEKLSLVLSDLTRRRGIIDQLYPRGSQHVVNALVPLAELLGYAAELRMLTSGNASFSMELSTYQSMSATETAKVVKKVTGFNP